MLLFHIIFKYSKIYRICEVGIDNFPQVTIIDITFTVDHLFVVIH